MFALACESPPSTAITADSSGDPEWRFNEVRHQQLASTLTDVWVSSNEDVVAVGWDGTILARRYTEADPSGNWQRMSVPTTVNLTAVVGVENGRQFGLAGPLGEMFAVGWEGTLLHFHPNPDDDPATDDGVWTPVSGPDAPNGFVAQVRVDLECPDYDGDGIPDDGNGDGWAGDTPCATGEVSGCDDNCRTSPNGNLRPITVHVPPDNCIDASDGPSLDPNDHQPDGDTDGIGDACDQEFNPGATVATFAEPLFGLWADASGDQLTVVAVGGDGSMVHYAGASSAVAVMAPTLPVTDGGAWTAQTGLPFRYEDDCTSATPGDTCDGGRLRPPVCPAQCHPRKTICDCPTDQAQCCDDVASLTGAGCAAPLPGTEGQTCGAAPNACDVGSGVCSVNCPNCFRRLEQTLRAVAVDGDRVVAVGASGTVVQGSLSAPFDTWDAPVCGTVPPPLDEGPLITSVDARGGAFHLAGAGGAAFQFGGGSGCNIDPRPGVPGAFLAGVASTGANRAFVAGDSGTLFELDGASVVQHPLEVDVGFNGVAYGTPNGEQRLYVVGADGVIIRGAFF